MAETGFTVLQYVNSALRRVLEEEGSGANLFDNALDEFNRSILDLISYNTAWRFLRREVTLSTVADTKTVTLPTDCLDVNKVHILYGGSDYDLDCITEDYAAQIYPDDTYTGVPRAYIYGVYDTSSTSVPPIQVLELKPTPDQVYSLDVSYQASIKNYTSGDTAEVPPIPQYLQNALEQLLHVRMLRVVKSPRTEILEAKQEADRQISLAMRINTGKNKAQRAIRPRPAVSQWRDRRYNV